MTFLGWSVKSSEVQPTRDPYPENDQPRRKPHALSRGRRDGTPLGRKLIGALAIFEKPGKCRWTQMTITRREVLHRAAQRLKLTERQSWRDIAQSKGMTYLQRLPEAIPEGQFLVHNSARPAHPPRVARFPRVAASAR